MFTRPRLRRGPYALAEPSSVLTLLRPVLLVLIVIVALFFVGRTILRLFGNANELQRSSALLTVEGRGPVNVSLEGGAVQRAEDSLKLYGGDRVATGANGHGVIDFFDGSRLRLDQQTDVTLTESARGSTNSTIDLTVPRGTVFLKTPTAAVFSGSIIRTIHTPLLTLSIPSGTMLAAGGGSLWVFDADGLGISVSVKGGSEPITIGEGQQFVLPGSGELGNDPYAYRSALDTTSVRQAFVVSSRTLFDRPATSALPISSVHAEVLIVTEPAPDSIAESSTITVAGTVGKEVSRIRINGYIAPIDTSQLTFHQELALKEGEETEIRIEALDAQGIVLQEIRRVVKRDVVVPESPTIVAPAKTGETYRTQRTQFEIRGTASADAAGIIVNDYRLQLFKPGSRQWSYLASTELKNLVPGKNVFTVTAIDASGNRSEPVTLTVLLEEGLEGVVAGEGNTASAGSTTSAVNPAELPSNAPLKPGTLVVTGPTPGTTHTATGSELLIEGTTSSDTASMWVNDYKLQLYKPGKTTWNYIAKVEYRNLKPGKNTYVIVARNAQGEILDRVEYVVEYPR